MTLLEDLGQESTKNTMAIFSTDIFIITKERAYHDLPGGPRGGRVKEGLQPVD